MDPHDDVSGIAVAVEVGLAGLPFFRCEDDVGIAHRVPDPTVAFRHGPQGQRLDVSKS